MGASRDGSDQVWGLISTLVAGPAVWGAIGWGADRLAGTSFLTPVGVVLGFVTAFYVVYVKTSREDGSSTSPSSTTRRTPGGTTPGTGTTAQHDGRSAPRPGDAARPEPGDGR